MKKRFLAAVLGIMALSLTGCGEVLITDYSADTIVVNKDNSITGYNVSSFDKAYYDEVELENYIAETVDAYVVKYGINAVVKDEFDVTDKVARVHLDYMGYEDYAGFNGVLFYTGSVLSARAEGYELPSNVLFTEYAKDTEINETAHKVVVVGQTTDVEVEGTIIAASSNVTVKSKNQASVSFDLLDEDAQPGYIVYK